LANDPTPVPENDPLRKSLSGICFLVIVTLASPALLAASSPATEGELSAIIARIETAMAGLREYQAETTVSEYREGRLAETKRFLYSFRRPGHVRIDMKEPQGGMVLLYPDKDGKVAVTPGGWGRLLTLSLSPDNTLLRNSAGQRIDRTDLGTLFENMAHSLTDRRRGEPRITGQEGRVLMEVLAEDHFRAGVVTLYRFTIDTRTWLPLEVEECTPAGTPTRRVMFRDLNRQPHFPTGFFGIEGETR
jgi:outer membrane lipoprotein-sorting protein